MSDKSNRNDNESSEQDVNQMTRKEAENKVPRERVCTLLEENIALQEHKEKLFERNIELTKENTIMRNHINDCYSKNVNEPSEQEVNEMTPEEAEYGRLNKILKKRVCTLIDQNLALREYQLKNIELMKDRSAMLKHITECELKNAKLVELLNKCKVALKMLS